MFWLPSVTLACNGMKDLARDGHAISKRSNGCDGNQIPSRHSVRWRALLAAEYAPDPSGCADGIDEGAVVLRDVVDDLCFQVASVHICRRPASRQLLRVPLGLADMRAEFDKRVPVRWRNAKARTFLPILGRELLEILRRATKEGDAERFRFGRGLRNCRGRGVIVARRECCCGARQTAFLWLRLRALCFGRQQENRFVHAAGNGHEFRKSGQNESDQQQMNEDSAAD